MSSGPLSPRSCLPRAWRQGSPQNSSCHAWPAPMCSLHRSHRVMDPPSRHVFSQPAQLRELCSEACFCLFGLLSSWALMTPWSREGITYRPGWSRHTGFFLMSPLSAPSEYLASSHVNGLTPSRNHLCA